MRISIYTDEDYSMLRSWWNASGMEPPLKEMIPETTFIAHLAGTPYLVVSLLMTNTLVAWIDNLIGNPSVDKKVRAEMTPKLLDYISVFAKNLGKTRLFCMSMRKSTDRFYKKLGFTPTTQVQAFIKEIQ